MNIYPPAVSQRRRLAAKRRPAVTHQTLMPTVLVTLMVATLMHSSTRTAAAQDGDEAANRHHPRPTITVTGEGEVQTRPDMVSIRVGVVTEAETAKQALSDNNQAMQQLFDVLDRVVIAEKDRQTSQFSITPQYRQDDPSPRPRRTGPEAGEEPRIVGYQVTNELRIKVREVSRLGTVLDGVVNAGSNRIWGIEFSVEDREPLMQQARTSAVKQARQRAEVLAEAAGVAVGRVLTIRDQAVSDPMPQGRMMMMAESRSTPIAPGEQTLTAQVQVVYEIDVDSNESSSNDAGAR